MNIKPTDKKLRNKLARQKANQIVEENGLRWSFVAKHLNMDQSNLAHWRKERFDFGDDRLRVIESFIDRYIQMNK